MSYPGDQWVIDTQEEVRKRYAQAERELDAGSIVWVGRTLYDIGAGLSPDSARSKHLADLGRALGTHNDGHGIPADAPNLIRGPLRYSVGNMWFDANGPVLPIFCHFMEAFSAFTRRPEEVRAQCVAIRDAGYQGIRALDVLGYYEFWDGREVTPIAFTGRRGKRVDATPDYNGQLMAFIDMLHSLGLKLMHDRGDLNALTPTQQFGHMIMVGECYRRLGEVGKETLAGLWACNESWQNGTPSPEECAKLIRGFGVGSDGWYPDTIGLSSPSDIDSATELDGILRYGIAPATVYTVHGNRVPNEHIIAHYLGYGYYQDALRRTGKRTWNTEPVGGGEGVSVGRVDDGELLAGIACEALLSGQAWTFMSGAGVKWDRPIENEPGFHAVANLHKILPKDLHTFTTIGHSGTRFRGTRILAAVDDPATRADYAIHADGRFVMLVYGKGAALPVERTFRGDIYNVETGHVTQNVVMDPSNRFPGGYRHCRLVIGTLA